MTIANTDSGTLKFGFGQLSNTTPPWMKYVLRTVLYLSMVWAFIAPTITELTPDTLNTINMWLLRANGLLSITIKFFGWESTDISNDQKQ